MSLRSTILLSSVAALGALGVFALAAATRLNFACFLIGVILWIFGLVPGAITLALAWWKARHWERTIALLVVWCAFCFGLLPAGVVGSWVLGKRVELSKLRAERVALQIELFHDRHGRYPADLAEVAKDGHAVRVPPLAYRVGFYTRWDHEPGYELSIEDPGGFLSGGWTWTSTVGEWQYWD